MPCNRISCFSNRSKQIQATHKANSTGTQYTQCEWKTTHVASQTTSCWSHVCCFSFKLCRVCGVPALKAVWSSWICLDRLLWQLILLCNRFSSKYLWGRHSDCNRIYLFIFCFIFCTLCYIMLKLCDQFACNPGLRKYCLCFDFSMWLKFAGDYFEWSLASVLGCECVWVKWGGVCVCVCVWIGSHTCLVLILL